MNEEVFSWNVIFSEHLNNKYYKAIYSRNDKDLDCYNETGYIIKTFKDIPNRKIAKKIFSSWIISN